MVIMSPAVDFRSQSRVLVLPILSWSLAVEVASKALRKVARVNLTIFIVLNWYYRNVILLYIVNL